MWDHFTSLVHFLYCKPQCTTIYHTPTRLSTAFSESKIMIRFSRWSGKNWLQSFRSVYKNDSWMLSSHLPRTYRNCWHYFQWQDLRWQNYVDKNWTKIKVGEFYFGLHGEHLGEYVFTSHVFFTFILPPIMLEAGYFLPKKPFFENIGQVLKFHFIMKNWNE